VSTEAIAIQAKALELLQAGLSGQFKRFVKQPMLTINPKDLPMLGVHIVREQRRADGDANHGPPSFVHDLTLGFSGSIQIGTDDAEEPSTLEAWMTSIDLFLLRNPEFVNMTEGVTSIDRLGQYAKNGEASLYEIRIEMHLQFRSVLEPIILDDLDVIHVETRYPTAGTDPERVQQVEASYDLSQT
jgi:hypothetical protein